MKHIVASALTKLAQATPEPLPPLTKREEESLAFCAEGLTSKAIALALRISEHTVKSHLSHLFVKLDVENRARAEAAAKWAAAI